jgi:hypothetical protein
MLKTKADFTNYAFFKQTFDEAINDKKLTENIADKYFNSDKALETAIEKVSVPAGSLEKDPAN